MKLLASFLALASTAMATRLFAASYSGNITTLDLVDGAKGLSLAFLNTTNGCAPSPVWLELNYKTSTLYCTDEGTDGVASTVSSFRTEKDGSLTLNSKLRTPFGSVSAAVYGNSSALAVAHYSDSFTAISLAQPYNLTIIESFNLSTPDVPKPLLHQSLLDPWGKHIFVPSLKTDQVHWYSIDPVSFKLSHDGHISLPAGSGPRHGVFYNPPGREGGIFYYYVVTETSNMIHGFKIVYDKQKKITNTVSVYNSTVFGDGNIIPATKMVYGAEIKLTPDEKFIIASVRNDTRSSITSSLTNLTGPSDSLITFRIPPTGGPLLEALPPTPAGGSFPRHFSLNKKGDLIAVALQMDNKVVILRRDLKTGVIGNEIVSEIVLDGQVTAVIWDDDLGQGGGNEVNGGNFVNPPGPVPVQNGSYSSSTSSSKSTKSIALATTVSTLTTIVTSTLTVTACGCPTTSSLKSVSVVAHPTLTPGQQLDEAGKPISSKSLTTFPTSEPAPAYEPEPATKTQSTYPTTSSTSGGGGYYSTPETQTPTTEEEEKYGTGAGGMVNDGDEASGDAVKIGRNWW